MPEKSRPIQLAQAGEAQETGRTTEKNGVSHAAKGESHAEAGHDGHHEYKLGDIPEAGMLFANGVIVTLLLGAFGLLAARNLKKLPGKVWSLQNVGEFIVEAMTNFTRGIIGPGGEKYVPLVGTVFLFIFFGNLWGQIPGFHSPTANLSTTLALGVVVFLYVQYVGIKSNGLGGYVKHFMGPMPAIAPLLLPIEIISELVKPFTLAMRLFGNIFGEDTVIIVLATLAVTMMPGPLKGLLPFQFPILVLGLLTAFVQALVFSLLTCIYLSLQSHHDSEHDGEHHATGHGHPGIEESGLVP